MINPSVTIERAAVIPGEDVFLSQLVDNFTDEACKLVYADWLEEHGIRCERRRSDNTMPLSKA